MSEQQKKYGMGVKVAVLAIIVVQYSMSNISPVLGVINENFAGQGYDFWIKQIETISMVTMVITGLSIGFLLKRFRKKTLLIAGSAIMMVFGVLPAILGDNFWGILIPRLFMGFGMGIVYPFAASYVIDLFQGKERDSLMGIRSTVGAIAGIIIAQASGNLCDALGYKASFWIPIIILPILLLFMSQIPTDTIPEVKEDTAEKQAGEGKKLNKFSWMHILGNVIIMVCAYTFMTNIGIIGVSPVEAGGLGISAADVGNIMTVFSVVMAVSGLMFSPIFLRVFGRFTTAAGGVMLGVGLLAGYLAPNVPMMFVAAIIFGFGFQVYNGAFVLSLSETTRPEHVAYATSIFMAFNGVGQFFSAILVPAIANVTVKNLRGDWLIGSIGLLALAAVVIIAIAVSGYGKKSEPIK